MPRFPVPRTRLLGYGLALAVVLLASFGPWNDDAREEGMAPGTASARVSEQRPATAAGGAGELVTLNLEALGRRELPASRSDLFPATSWQPPPPPPARAGPSGAERPQLPPLPFVYLGRMRDRGVPHVFLGVGDRAVVAKVGETLEGNYRVTRIDEDSVSFLYLPLRAKQTFRIPPRSESVQGQERSAAAPSAPPSQPALDHAGRESATSPEEPGTAAPSGGEERTGPGGERPGERATPPEDGRGPAPPRAAAE